VLIDKEDKMTQLGLCKVKRQVRAATKLDQDIDDDWVIEEQAIALVYNGISHAVMMATPCDLVDFAIGFSLSEGIISKPKDILAHDIVDTEQGIEVQLNISSRQFSALKHKRRSLLGNSGCGLCGVESLAQTVKVRTKLEVTPVLPFQVIHQAVDAFKQQQKLNELTGSVHAAAFCHGDTGEILCIREDVGRHNALDKLLGALAQQPQIIEQKLHNGFILVSSRASYEMVDKTIAAGIKHLVSISAATSKAIQWAQQHQLNLIGFARSKRHIVYSNK
jgi:FdhD protein